MAVQWSVPVWMWPLLLVVAAGAVLWSVVVYRRTRPVPTRPWRRVLVALRATVLALLTLAVAGPVASCLRRTGEPAELVYVIEDSGSMALTDAEPGAVASSRWQQSLAAVAAIDSSFANRRPPVRRLYLRGNGLQPLQEFDPLDPATPAPARHGTSLADLSRQLRERLAGRPVRAIVLVSDGNETTAGPGEAALANAAAALPLQVAGVGAITGPPDRSVQDLRYPPVVYSGDEVVVDCAVEQRDLPAGAAAPLVVTLRDDLGIVAADTVVTGDPVVPVRLVYRARGEGLQALRLDAAPLVSERYLENNRATLAVDVRRDRARVLLLAATPGWDVRFLAQAAAGERRVALSVVYPDARGLVLADSMRRWQPPVDAAGWGRWDAVVLTGWTGADARIDWAALGQAVDAGLGLLVLPSAAVSPTGAAALAGPPAGLAALLPVEAASWRWESGSRFARAVDGAAGHAVLEGVATGGADGSSVFAALPPWRETARVVPRGGGTVLLEAVTRGGAGAALPALVVGPRGQGRVAWLGVRHVWEWAFWEAPRGGESAGPEQPARRVLRNLLVWLTGAAEQAGLEFAARPGVYQEGQPIRLNARWRDMRGEPVVGRATSVSIRAENDTTAGGVRTFALTASATVPGDSDVELPPLQPGRYTAQLTGAGEPPVVGPAAGLVVTDASIERTQVRQDRRRLEQLTARAGGDYVDLSEPGAISGLRQRLEAMDWQGAENRQRRRFDLWSGWPFIVTIAVLLGCEWFLRRRHGLL